MSKAIALVGNVTEGYTAYGPYESWDIASETHEFEDCWIMTLDSSKTAKETSKDPRGKKGQ